jgi:hypothetical protein
MNSISDLFDVDIIKEICKDYFQNRGYEAEMDAVLFEDLRWRPSVIAKKNQEIIALEVRTTEDLPDIWQEIFKETKNKAPNVGIYLCIPGNVKISNRLISEITSLGIGIYQIDGTNLKKVYTPDQKAIASVTEELGQKRQEFVISPNTPYGNIRALRTIIRECNKFIYWFEPHFAKNGIEYLYDELEEGNLMNVQEIRILCGPKKVTSKFKDDFHRFMDECKKLEIKAKCKVICDKEILRELHDRYLITHGTSYSLMPLSSLEMGQWGSLFKTAVQFPFERYWKKAKDINRKWDEINRVGEEIRQKEI